MITMQQLFSLPNFRGTIDFSEFRSYYLDVYVNELKDLDAAKFMAANILSPDFSNLVVSLCTQNPKFQFELAPRTHNLEPDHQAKHNCNTIVAWQKDTYLGKVHLSRGQYELSNQRIDKKLKRGHSRKTGDLNRALQIFKGDFKPPSQVELLEEAHEKIVVVLPQYLQTVWNIVRVFKPALLSKISPAGTKILLQLLADEGLEEKEVEKYRVGMEEYETISSVVTDKRFNPPKLQGTIVFIGDDGCYYTQRYDRYQGKSDGHRTSLPVDSYRASDVPDNIRAGVGMLKLLEDGSFLFNVGFRLNRNSFYIKDET